MFEYASSILGGIDVPARINLIDRSAAVPHRCRAKKSHGFVYAHCRASDMPGNADLEGGYGTGLGLGVSERKKKKKTRLEVTSDAPCMAEEAERQRTFRAN